MSEMRKDVFSGRWVITDETHAVEPSVFRFQPFTRTTGFCPFCETNEASTPAEVFAARGPGSAPNGPGWTVRVVPASHPRLRIEGHPGRRAEGFHDLMNGVGAHEIIIETPHHDKSLHELEVHEIAAVLAAFAARILDLQGDPRLRYILIFKNHGVEAGAHMVTHSISQLLALPVTPRTIKSKLAISRDYYAAKERCIYCDVIGQELREERRMVAQNDGFVALAPFASRFPFEMTVLPKHHRSMFSGITPAEMHHLAQILRDVLGRLDTTLGGPPYNLSLQDSPRPRRREGYWTTIEQDFHWHLEVLPQIFLIEGFEWGSGFFYNPVPAELATRMLLG